MFRHIFSLVIISIFTFSGILGIYLTDFKTTVDNEIRKSEMKECKKTFRKNKNIEKFEVCMRKIK